MINGQIGYIKHCHFISREGGPHPLSRLPTGGIVVLLDGYTILPTEQYAALTSTFNSDSDGMLADALATKPELVTLPGPASKVWRWLNLALMWVGGLALGYLTWGVG